MRLQYAERLSDDRQRLLVSLAKERSVPCVNVYDPQRLDVLARRSRHTDAQPQCVRAPR